MIKQLVAIRARTKNEAKADFHNMNYKVDSLIVSHCREKDHEEITFQECLMQY